jgi:methionyl-tRNA formyltransferase
LNGTELVDEWHQLQAEATINLCLQWIDNYQDLINSAHPQTGEASHYHRRRPADSRLNPDRPLAEQFELLRVVDNNRYPAFFEWRGRCYEVEIRHKHK